MSDRIVPFPYEVENPISKYVNYAGVIPDSFVVDFVPAAENQGAINSCAAHAVVSALEILLHNRGTDVQLSEDFVYGYRPVSYPVNSFSLFDALRTIISIGTVEKETFDFPLEESNSLRLKVDGKLPYLKAENLYKATGHFVIRAIADIKKALLSGCVPLISVPFLPALGRSGGDTVEYEGGVADTVHALAVVGYKSGYLRVLNSFGTSWKDNGQAWLSMSFPIQEMYGLYLPKKFTDIPQGHWAEKDINEMSIRGLISGVGDGKFNLDGTLTRAEYASLTNRILKYLGVL